MDAGRGGRPPPAGKSNACCTLREKGFPAQRNRLCGRHPERQGPSPALVQNLAQVQPHPARPHPT